MKPWAHVEQDPAFHQLPHHEQLKVRHAYLEQANSDPNFHRLPPDQQDMVRQRIMPEISAGHQLMASMGMAPKGPLDGPQGPPEGPLNNLQSFISHARDERPEIQEKFKDHLREAEGVDPHFPAHAYTAAIKHLAPKDMAGAYALYESMQPHHRDAMLSGMDKSKDGMALKAQLFKELKKRTSR